MPFIENHETLLRRAFAWASPFYGAVTGVRNFLFDAGWKKSYRPGLPVICVGNLCAGGSGKTPLVEYLVRLIFGTPSAEGTGGTPVHHTACESGGSLPSVGIVTRGYGRQRKGNFLAEAGMNALEIGDEAVQYMDDFGREASEGRFALYLAGCRKEGIEALQQHYPALRTCILDDAFQHRQVEAGLNILVSDFNRPFFKDRLLPYGTLRERGRGSRRAQVVVFSKCPPGLGVEEKEEFLLAAGLAPYQKAFFSCVEYGDFVGMGALGGGWASPLGSGGTGGTPALPIGDAGRRPARHIHKVFLFTGIGNAQPLEDYLTQQGHQILVHRRFGDHHTYTENDIEILVSLYKKLCERQGPVLLLTTQKDYCRLKNTPVFDYFCSLLGGRGEPFGLEGCGPGGPHALGPAYIPIRTRFLFDQEAEFNALIRNFVNK